MVVGEFLRMDRGLDANVMVVPRIRMVKWVSLEEGLVCSGVWVLWLWWSESSSWGSGSL